MLIQSNRQGVTSIQGLAYATAGLNQKELTSILIKNQNLLAARALGQEQLKNFLILKGYNAEKAEEIVTEVISTQTKIAQTTATNAQTAANAGLTMSIKNVIIGLKAQAAAWLSSPMGMATIAIGSIIGIVVACNALNTSIKEQTDIVNGLNTEFNDYKSQLDEISSKITANKDKIAEINKNPLSIIDKETLSTLEAENVELERQLALAKALSTETEKQLGQETLKLFDKKGDMGGNASGRKRREFDEIVSKQIEDVAKTKAELTQLENDYLSDSISKNKYDKKKDGLAERLQEQKQALTENIKFISENKDKLLENVPEQKTLLDTLTSITDQYLAISKIDTGINTFDEIFASEFTKEQQEDLVKLADQGQLTVEKFKYEYPVVLEIFKLLGINIEDVIDKIEEMNAQEFLPKAKESASLTSVLDAYIGKLETVKSAQDELSENNILTSSTIQSLISAYPELEGVLSNYLAGLASSKDVFASLEYVYNNDANAYKRAMAEKMSTDVYFYQSVYSQNKEAFDKIGQKYDVDLSNYKSLAEAKFAIETKLVSSLGGLWSKYINAATGAYTTTFAKDILLGFKPSIGSQPVTLLGDKKAQEAYEQASNFYKEKKAQEEQVKKELATVQAEFDKLSIKQIKLPDFSGFSTKNGSNTKNSSKSGSGKNEKTEDLLLKAFEKAYEDLKYQREAELINEVKYFNELTYLNNHFFKGKKKYIKDYRQHSLELFDLQKKISQDKVNDIKHQNFLLEQQESQENKIIANNKKMQDILHKMANDARARGLNDNDDFIQDLSKQWWELEKNTNEIFKQIKENAIKEQEEIIENMDTTVSAISSVIDAEIDKLNEEKEAIKKTNDEKERSIELLELEERLANAKEQKNQRVYYEDRGWVWEANQKEIDNAQKDIDKFKHEDELRVIDEKIKAWEDYKKLWTSIADEGKLAQDKLIAAQVLGADWENNILNKRTDRINTFKNDYIAALQEIIKYQEMTDKQFAIDNGYIIDESSANSLNGSTDYAQKMLNSKDLAELQYYSDKRNEKIKNLGIIPERNTKDIFMEVQNKINSSGSSSNTSSNGSSSNGSSSNQKNYLTNMANGKNADGSKANAGQVSWAKNELKNKKYSKGTKNADGGLSLVDEEGKELITHKPNQGRYTILEPGDNVFPANMTKNLWEWAKTTPIKVLEQLNSIKIPNMISEPTSYDNSTKINNLTVQSNANNFNSLIRDIQVKVKNR